MGTSPAPHVKLQSFEGIVPKVTNWRTLGLNDEELALSSLVPTKARAPA